MILINTAEKTTTNLDHLTVFDVHKQVMHLVSRRHLDLDQDHTKTLVSMLFDMLPNTPAMFILPNCLFNMENVERISYHDEQATLHFCNGNTWELLPEDVEALLALFEHKRAKLEAAREQQNRRNIDLWFPGKEGQNGQH